MRRRLQSVSLAACKDKPTLKTAFYYDNVGGWTFNNKKHNEVQKVVPVVPVKTLTLVVRMNCILDEDDVGGVKNI